MRNKQMQSLLLTGGTVCRSGGFARADVRIEAGKIAEIGPSLTAPADCARYDAAGKTILPGLIDVHTHGAVNVDAATATESELHTLAHFYARHGVTGFLASVAAAPREDTFRAIRTLTAFRKQPQSGARLLGIHLEGPFLSPDRRGCMEESALSPMDLGLVRAYQEAAEGQIRYITVAPEAPGVIDAIPALRALGMTVAIGHSDADYDTAMAAIRAGAAAVTHTMNAMRPLDRHEPGILGAALESDVFCEAILDGRHLHPGIVRLLLKAKGMERVVGITDSIMAAGLPDGIYRLGSMAVRVTNGDARLLNADVRAGSTLTMDQALRNLMTYTGEDAAALCRLLSENPARLLGAFDRTGSLDAGKDADLTVWDAAYAVCDTFVGGERVQ